MKTKGILIAVVFSLLFPAAALAQFNVTVSKTKSKDPDGKPFQGDGIATAEKGVGKTILISVGAGGSVAEPDFAIDFTADIANPTSGVDGIVLKVSGTITATLDSGNSDFSKGEFVMDLGAGGEGDSVEISGVRFDLTTASPVTATLKPRFNTIAIEGIPGKVVTVVDDTKAGFKITVNDTAEVLTGGLKADTTAELLFDEGIDDVFRSKAESEVDNGEVLAANEVQIIMDLVNPLPSGLEFDLSIKSDNVGTDLSKSTVDAQSDLPVTIKFESNRMDKKDDFTLTLTVTENPVGLALGAIDASFTLGPGTGTPSFAVSKIIVTVIKVLPGTTNLLVPLVISQPPFDTGLQVSNTLEDPFGKDGAAALIRSGKVTFHFFSNDEAIADFSYVTTAGSPGVGLNAVGEIVAGGTYTVLASELLAAAGFAGSFTGYIFAIAEFTHAHGAGFISDFANFTQGTPALVLTTLDSAGKPVAIETESRGGQNIETLGN